MDIFNLGQCSKSFKNLVLSEVIHPVSTELQCIKTIHKHYYNTRLGSSGAISGSLGVLRGPSESFWGH